MLALGNLQVLGTVMSFLTPVEVGTLSNASKEIEGAWARDSAALLCPAWLVCLLDVCVAAGVTTILWAVKDCIVTQQRLRCFGGESRAVTDVLCVGLGATRDGPRGGLGMGVVGPAKDVRITHAPLYDDACAVRVKTARQTPLEATVIHRLDAEHVIFGSRCVPPPPFRSPQFPFFPWYTSSPILPSHTSLPRSKRPLCGSSRGPAR